MSELFSHGVAERLSLTFNTAFPIGGFVTSAFASMLLEFWGERQDLYMGAVVLMALTFGFATLGHTASSQYAGAMLFGPTRTLQWSCYFHFLSLPQRYLPQYVGRLIGYGNLALALIGDFPPYILNSYVAGGMSAVEAAAASAEALSVRGSTAAERYYNVHVGLQLLLLFCTAFPIYLVGQRTRELLREIADAEQSAPPPPPPAEGSSRMLTLHPQSPRAQSPRGSQAGSWAGSKHGSKVGGSEADGAGGKSVASYTDPDTGLKYKY